MPVSSYRATIISLLSTPACLKYGIYHLYIFYVIAFVQFLLF